MQVKNIVESIKSLWTSITTVETDINDLKKVKREILFNNQNNTSKTIQLNKSAYNYSYLYIEQSSNYNAIIPIYNDEQTNLRGTGGWTGPANAGTCHFYGTLSNGGMKLNVTYFRGLVHTANGDHNAGDDYDITLVVGVR